jgi:hypothetical protein
MMAERSDVDGESPRHEGILNVKTYVYLYDFTRSWDEKGEDILDDLPIFSIAATSRQVIAYTWTLAITLERGTARARPIHRSFNNFQLNTQTSKQPWLPHGAHCQHHYK